MERVPSSNVLSFLTPTLPFLFFPGINGDRGVRVLKPYGEFFGISDNGVDSGRDEFTSKGNPLAHYLATALHAYQSGLLLSPCKHSAYGEIQRATSQVCKPLAAGRRADGPTCNQY